MSEEQEEKGTLTKEGGGGIPWINPAIQSEVTWRDDDIVVSVPGKSGTTWTMNIVHQLREGGDRNLEDVYAEVPWLEAVEAPGVTAQEMAAKIDAMDDNRRRAFKTHSFPPVLPYRKDVQYVVVVRNPDEAVASMKPFVENHTTEFHEFWGVPSFSWPSFQEFYDDFVIDKEFFKSFYYFVANWWPHLRESNVCVLHYTDMVSDHEGTIKKISDFLGFGPYTDEQWETILECTSYTWMKRHGSKFDGKTIWPVPVLNQGTMVRRGTSGVAQEDGMTEELSRDMADRGREILKDEKVFEWMYKGGQLP